MCRSVRAKPSIVMVNSVNRLKQDHCLGAEFENFLSPTPTEFSGPQATLEIVISSIGEHSFSIYWWQVSLGCPYNISEGL